MLGHWRFRNLYPPPQKKCSTWPLLLLSHSRHNLLCSSKESRQSRQLFFFCWKFSCFFVVEKVLCTELYVANILGHWFSRSFLFFFELSGEIDGVLCRQSSAPPDTRALKFDSFPSNQPAFQQTGPANSLAISAGATFFHIFSFFFSCKPACNSTNRTTE